MPVRAMIQEEVERFLHPSAPEHPRTTDFTRHALDRRTK
jgi:hypothetical protein